MESNVWFDDASIIHKTCNEKLIDEETRDALLRLNKAYQRAKHGNEFDAKEDDTTSFGIQTGTLKQADGHSHVVVKAGASNTSIKVGEVVNGTDCIIKWQDTFARALRIEVEIDEQCRAQGGWEVAHEQFRAEGSCKVVLRPAHAPAHDQSRADRSCEVAHE